MLEDTIISKTRKLIVKLRWSRHDGALFHGTRIQKESPKRKSLILCTYRISSTPLLQLILTVFICYHLLTLTSQGSIVSLVSCAVATARNKCEREYHFQFQGRVHTSFRTYNLQDLTIGSHTESSSSITKNAV